MRDAQIERLLGGYATNTLTESERQALFAAALEDQELFDALQDEQALRELLEDPASRPLIERAVAQPRPERPGGRFAGGPRFAPTWAWALAGCVAAGGVLVLVLGPLGQPPRIDREVAVLTAPDPLQSAAPATAPEVPVPAPKAPERRAVVTPGTLAKRESAPKGVAPKVAAEVARLQSNAQISSSAGAAVPAVATPPAAAVAPPAPQLPGSGGDQAQVAIVDKLKHVLPGIPYVLVRRGGDGAFSTVPPGTALEAGDSVRMVVRPPEPGLLTLFEQSPEGNWNTIQTLQVAARREYTVPQAPIQVNGETRLRLVLTPGEVVHTELQKAAKSALRAPKQRLDTERGTASAVAVSPIPERTLTTDITLVPGKAAGQ